MALESNGAFLFYPYIAVKLFFVPNIVPTAQKQSENRCSMMLKCVKNKLENIVDFTNINILFFSDFKANEGNTEDLPTYFVTHRR
jgi:hypothetical protein